MHPRAVTLLLAAAAVLIAACSITAAQVEALSGVGEAGGAIQGDEFRDFLGLLIVNIALRTAAEDQFDLAGLNDPDRIADRISDPPGREQSVFRSIEQDPLLTVDYAAGAAEYFLIREAVLGEIATDDPLDDLARDQLFDAWIEAAVAVAEVTVRSHVGVWGGFSAGVLPPP